MRNSLWVLGLSLNLVFGVAVAQDGAAAASESAKQIAALGWHAPGKIGQVGSQATFKASEQYTFLNAADTDKFLQLNGNPPQKDSYTIAATKSDWFGVLSFEPEGYVKDDEKIDADELLKTLKAGNEEGAKKRKEQGYSVLRLEGWAIPPRYDTQNKRLEWGTQLRDETSGDLIVNVSTKILGRSGYTTAILVTNPKTVEQDLADFKVALNDFEYVSGEKYSEWKQGDKVAAYGLGALVLGGAAAAATSKGGFKAIGIAILAGLAALWGAIKRFFSRNKD